jgi:hemoglobin
MVAPTRSEAGRATPTLRLVASVALRFDTPRAIGETPDGVRFDFPVHGTVEGPELNGTFPPCAAYLLIDPDGVGTINVRAPLLLRDGAVAELEATGRYDFGADGYRRAIAKDLPNSALGWCPRLLTGDPRYAWLNRTLLLGVGELRPRETRVDYDLFVIVPTAQAAGSDALPDPDRRTVYEGLGGRPGVQGIASDFIDALVGDARLNRQNPKVALAHGRLKGDLRRQGIELLSALFCKLTGGPCQYVGKPLKEAHAHLDITDADWTIGIDQLEKILSRRNIPRLYRDKFVEIINGTKSDIIADSRDSRPLA